MASKWGFKLESAPKVEGEMSLPLSCLSSDNEKEADFLLEDVKPSLTLHKQGGGKYLQGYNPSQPPFQRRRPVDSSDSDDSDLEFSSEGEGNSDTDSRDSSDDYQRHRQRSRSPQRHKMPTYSGKERWEPFTLKFTRIIKDNKWSDRKTKQRFFDCLVGDALEYADKLLRTLVFTKFEKKIKERFSDKDVPVVACRELNFTRQEENESLADFAQRIQTITEDGFRHHNQESDRYRGIPQRLKREDGGAESHGEESQDGSQSSEIHKGLGGQSACSV
ncbi:hypothetical protein KP79_PYT02734 [Mizuhopecten yessoensis]|uniref:Retrotransposon gag domain-containing protein n=1 Tax=Mizuhopecten yessoensis TaxID=6573 RepID=A0A210PK42_MIZYE|nr:hypothetical protein KP79_PYT02734 [Mizuhopecten yessoensis]